MMLEKAASLPFIILVDSTKRCVKAQEHFQSQGYEVAIVETIESLDAAIPPNENRRIIGFINPYAPLPDPAQAFITYFNLLGERAVYFIWTDWGGEIETQTHDEGFGLGGWGVVSKKAHPTTLLSYLRLAQRVWSLRDMSSQDFLTGLENRRGFFASVTALVDSASRYGHPEHVCAVVIDLNDFKEVNDLYGHAAGDETLRFVADGLKKRFGRASDHLCRPGGDEFWIVTPESEAAVITQVASLKQYFAQSRFPLKKGVEIEISLSAGIAQMSADEIKELAGKRLAHQDIVNVLLDSADLAETEEKKRYHEGRKS